MKERVIVTLAVVVLIFSAVGNAHAQSLTRVVFNGWTQVQPEGNPPVDKEYIAFIVYATFHPVAYAPTYVKDITITAPDGSTFSLDPANDWLMTDWAFYKRFLATDFKSGTIPSGTYKATVISNSGTTIAETDTIAATFISVPTITYPTAGQTGVPAMPTLKWTAVKGAKFYRVVLWVNGWDPVFNYYDARNNLQTDLTSVRIPKGALKPNTQYKLQIQARGDSNDLDRRSNSSWVYFTTGSW
jgi:hypothetical protein